MVNFKTMTPLQKDEMAQIGIETFIPYWKGIFTNPDSDSSAEEESVSTSPESEGESLLRVPERAMKSMFYCAENIQCSRAASTLRRSFVHAPSSNSRSGSRTGPIQPNDDQDPDTDNSGERQGTSQNSGETGKKKSGKKTGPKPADSMLPEKRNNPSRTADKINTFLSEDLLQELQAFNFNVMPSTNDIQKTFELMTTVKPIQRVSTA